MKIIEVIIVVIKNFLPILGLIGAPGSKPSILSSNFFLVDCIPNGKTEKKITHQIKT